MNTESYKNTRGVKISAAIMLKYCVVLCSVSLVLCRWSPQSRIIDVGEWIASLSAKVHFFSQALSRLSPTKVCSSHIWLCIHRLLFYGIYCVDLPTPDFTSQFISHEFISQFSIVWITFPGIWLNRDGNVFQQNWYRNFIHMNWVAINSFVEITFQL